MKKKCLKSILIQMSSLSFFIMNIMACNSSTDLRFYSKQKKEGNDKVTTVDVKASHIDAYDKKRILLLFNRASIDSSQIAEYYATKRNDHEILKCGVLTHTSIAGEPSDLLYIRKQIIEDCLCPQYRVSGICDSENIDSLLNEKNLPTHLVIVKGIPTQLRNTPWKHSNLNIPVNVQYKEHPSSFDYYLAYSLLNDKATCSSSNCLFGSDSNGISFLPWFEDYSDVYRARYNTNTIDSDYYINTFSGVYPELKTNLHRALAYGRIEGITVESTFKMLDRTIEAERRGLSGNILGSLDSIVLPVKLNSVFGANQTNCYQSIVTGTFPNSDTACRVGWDLYGTPPYVNSQVNPVNRIMAFIGENLTNNPLNIAQHGFFDNTYTLMNWKRDTDSCLELCSQFVDESKVDACRKESIDPFKEINTNCVGVEAGFFGTQKRSYPTQMMAVYPPGWNTFDQGPFTATPLELSKTGGVKNERFHDESFGYFGDLKYQRKSECPILAGGISACDPRVEIFANRSFEVTPPIGLNDSSHQLEYSFFWKGYSAKESSLKVLFKFKTSNQNEYTYSHTLLVDAKGNGWKQERRILTIPQGLAESLVQLKVSVESMTVSGGSAGDEAFDRIPIYGHFAIDGFEAVDKTVNRELIGIKEGSFNLPYDYHDANLRYTVSGDWAGHIHRLGGVAWIGSMSHYFTGGYAYERRDKWLDALTRGLTMGESLLYTGQNQSAIFYGDPLYRPFRAAIYLPQSLFEKNAPLSGRSVTPDSLVLPNSSFNNPDRQTIVISPFSSDLVKKAPLYFDAAFSENTEWEVSICEGVANIDQCNWDVISEGKGKAIRAIVPGTEKGVFSLARGSGLHVFRLKVGPVGQIEKGLSQYTKLYFVTEEVLAKKYYINYARVRGTSWADFVKEDSYVPGNMLASNPKVGLQDINQLEIRCEERYGICNPETLSLQLNSSSQTQLPNYTKEIQLELDDFGSLVHRIFFNFHEALPRCSRVEFTLTDDRGIQLPLSSLRIVEADANGDGKVDAVDFNAIRGNFGLFQPFYNPIDFNGDGYIDLLDFNVFRGNLGCVVD